MKKRFIAQIKDKGLHFKPQVRNMFIDHLSQNEGDYLEITPRKKKATVSDELRGFYWGAWLTFIQKLDDQFRKYEIEEIHEFLKAEFNGNDVYNPISKQTTRITKSVMQNQIKTSEALVYMEKISRWVAENYGEEMPNAQEYKFIRDTHFNEDMTARVEYPEHEGEVQF